MAERIAGHLEVTRNGSSLDVFGSFTVNLGKPKREALLNAKGDVVGFKVTYQAPSAKGEVRKSSSLNITRDLLDMEDATVVATFSDGTKFMLEGAFYSADGDIESDEGKVQFECQAETGTEM